MAKIHLKSGFAMNAEIHTGLVPMDTVFMHGNLASNRWWLPALEIWKQQAESNREGRLIFAEWRGSGKSAAPQSEAELDMTQLAQDYIDLLEEMGVKKACIVGHSTGGLIALFAMLKAPHLFDRAVLLDPVAAIGVQFGPEMYDAFTQMSKDRSFCELIMGSTIYQNDASSPFFKELCDDSFNIAQPNWHGIPNALKKVNILSDLEHIKQPVLVLHGEHDALLPMAESVTMAKHLGNGQFHEIKGQGHCTNVENPALFVKLVNDFLFKR